jgi:hypothetical protein
MDMDGSWSVPKCVAAGGATVVLSFLLLDEPLGSESVVLLEVGSKDIFCRARGVVLGIFSLMNAGYAPIPARLELTSRQELTAGTDASFLFGCPQL